MRLTNKIHRVLSIIAAVLILLITVFNSGSTIMQAIRNGMISNPDYLAVTIPNLVFNLMIAVLFAVVLFRGIKDKLAGVLLIVTAAIHVLTGVIARIPSLVSYVMLWIDYRGAFYLFFLAGGIIYLISALVTIAFRIIAAVECFYPGKISTGAGKMLLVFLPLVAAVISAVGLVVQQLYIIFQHGFLNTAVGIFLPAVLSVVFNVVWVLAGLALASPVYEAVPTRYTYNRQNSLRS